VDISNAMLKAARTLADHPALHFEQGNAAILPYPTGHFDGATAARMLLHVTDHQAVLDELRRVVRPGGRLALLEWDWGTLAIDHCQRAVTRRILDWRCDNYGGNNWMGRQLVRRCMEAGWKIRSVEPMVNIARDNGAGILDTLRRTSGLAVEHNIISGAEREAWINEIDQRLAEGTFFATINDYIVVVD
jgi:ubiquinone/menaquinone biosynthesis C-methylase UbiE